MANVISNVDWCGASETMWEITSVGDQTPDGTVPVRYIGERGKMKTTYVSPEQAVNLREGGFLPENLR